MTEKEKEKNIKKKHCTTLSYYSSLNKLDLIFSNFCKTNTEEVVKAINESKPGRNL